MGLWTEKGWDRNSSPIFSKLEKNGAYRLPYNASSAVFSLAQTTFLDKKKARLLLLFHTRFSSFSTTLTQSYLIKRRDDFSLTFWTHSRKLSYSNNVSYHNWICDFFLNFQTNVKHTKPISMVHNTPRFYDSASRTQRHLFIFVHVFVK